MDGDGSGVASQRWTAYDGANPYADFDSEGSLITRYLYGLAIDELYGRIDSSGNVDWYLSDYLGSVRQIVNSDGTVFNNLDFDSFGQLLSESNPENGDRFGFTSRERDGTGQYYVRARYYGPDTGRFASPDPMGFAAGDTNLYRYVGNSPAIFTDPTGLAAKGPAERWRERNGLPPIGPDTRSGGFLEGFAVFVGARPRAPRPDDGTFVNDMVSGWQVFAGAGRMALGCGMMLLGGKALLTGNYLGIVAIDIGVSEIRNGDAMIWGRPTQGPFTTQGLTAIGVDPLNAHIMTSILGIGGSFPLRPTPVGLPGVGPSPSATVLRELTEERFRLMRFVNTADEFGNVNIFELQQAQRRIWEIEQEINRVSGQIIFNNPPPFLQ